MNPTIRIDTNKASVHLRDLDQIGAILASRYSTYKLASEISAKEYELEIAKTIMESVHRFARFLKLDTDEKLSILFNRIYLYLDFDQQSEYNTSRRFRISVYLELAPHVLKDKAHGRCVLQYKCTYPDKNTMHQTYSVFDKNSDKLTELIETFKEILDVCVVKPDISIIADALFEIFK
jgi:hypothetical protein